MNNIFSSLPEDLTNETIEELGKYGNVRIERILSKGHASPAEGWYDQGENEWVVVLEGSGTILFENDVKVDLQKGDYMHIPSHAKHKVIWTDPNQVTVWLAFFYT